MKTVPAMPSINFAVASSPLLEQVEISPAPTKTGSPFNVGAVVEVTTDVGVLLRVGVSVLVRVGVRVLVRVGVLVAIGLGVFVRVGVEVLVAPI